MIFTENKECEIRIFLVAIDQEGHLKILNDIMTIFSEKEKINKIIKCKEKQKVIEVFNEILEI